MSQILPHSLYHKGLTECHFGVKIWTIKIKEEPMGISRCLYHNLTISKCAFLKLYHIIPHPQRKMWIDFLGCDRNKIGRFRNITCFRSKVNNYKYQLKGLVYWSGYMLMKFQRNTLANVPNMRIIWCASYDNHINRAQYDYHMFSSQN